MTNITNPEANDALDEEIDLDEDNVEEYTDSSDESQNNSKKNSSNFKKLSKAYKWALAKMKDLEKQLEASNNGTNEEMRFYFLENPEAKEYKQQMLETLERYPDMTIEDALLLAKQKTPKESQDKNDFDLSGKTPSKKKDLSDYTEEEALNLDNKSYLEWKLLNEGRKPWQDIWG